MRKAIVRGTLIENVAEVAAGSGWTPPAGTTAVDDPAGQASPGGTYSGAQFFPPTPSVIVPYNPIVCCALLADIQNSTITFADAVGLSFVVQPNQYYRFHFDVAFRTAATTTGIGLAVFGPASPILGPLYRRAIPTTLTVEGIQQGVGNDATATATGSIDAANADRLAVVEGLLATGANGGTLQLRFKSEIAASAVTIRRGSFGRMWAVK